MWELDPLIYFYNAGEDAFTSNRIILSQSVRALHLFKNARYNMIHSNLYFGTDSTIETGYWLTVMIVKGFMLERNDWQTDFNIYNVFSCDNEIFTDDLFDYNESLQMIWLLCVD